MSDTTHEVLVKFKGDTKDLEQSTARIAKDANKLSKDQKKTFGESFKKQKEQQKVAGPREQKKTTQELKNQNKELQATNRLLGTQLTWWQKIARAAKGALGGGGKGRGGGGGGKGGGRTPGFMDGFRHGLGPNPDISRKGLGVGAAHAFRGGLGIAGGLMAYLATLPIQTVQSDYQAYISNQRGMGGLAGLSKGSPFGAGLTTASVRTMQGRMGEEYGYSPEETISGARSFARATGNSDFTEAGMGNAKVLGLGADEVASIFGDIRKGSGSFGEKGLKDFQRILAAGVKSGVDASTLPEYFEGISSLVNRAGGAAGGAVSALPYAQILAMFEKSGAAGLKGARGASVASALEEGFKAPGGGDEGTAAVMGSLGYGRAGGNVSYYEAKKMMQQGFSGEGGAGALKNLFDYVDNITGGGEESNLYMEGLMGGRLSLDQIETARKAVNGGASSKDVEAMMAEMTASELDVLHNIDENTRAFVAAGALASKLQLEDIDRGAEYAKSVEAYQAAMQHFLTVVAPHLADAMESLVGVLENLMPGVESFAVASANLIREFGLNVTNPVAPLAEMASNITAGPEMRKNAVALEEAVDAANLTNGASDEELTAGISALLEAARLRREAVVNNLDAAVGDTLAGAGLGESPTARADAAAAADIRQAVVLLQQLADGAIANPENIRTQTDFMEIVRALAISIPPGPRAVTDGTGGAP